MIPYMVGKLSLNPTHFTRGVVKYVPGRSYFRDVLSRNGDKFVTFPPPPQSLSRGVLFYVAFSTLRPVRRTHFYCSRAGLFLGVKLVSALLTGVSTTYSSC